MESHPVPQNVTDFQFHLVGDMTLKQFTYLAIGLAFAYLLFVTTGSESLKDTIWPFVAWPLIIISALLGVAFAFLPIKERPLDHWAAAFMKAIFSPTQRKWKSERKDIAMGDPVFQKRLHVYLSQAGEPAGLEGLEEKRLFGKKPITSMAQMAPVSQQIVTPPPLQPQEEVSQPIAPPPPPLPVQPASFHTPPPRQSDQPAYAPPPPPPSTAQQSMPNPSPSNTLSDQAPPSALELTKMIDLAKEAQSIQAKIVDAQQQLDQIKQMASTPGANQIEYGQRFQEVLKKLQELTKHASEISYQLALISKTDPQKRNKVMVVPKASRVKQETITLTSIPNIINGVVTDSYGNYISGVIVVTHDKDGLPVRALKTNKLGQFVAATPLPSGVYTVTLEKEGMVFDDLQIELDGTVLPALKIPAKGGTV